MRRCVLCKVGVPDHELIVVGLGYRDSEYRHFSNHKVIIRSPSINGV